MMGEGDGGNVTKCTWWRGKELDARVKVREHGRVSGWIVPDWAGCDVWVSHVTWFHRLSPRNTYECNQASNEQPTDSPQIGT